MPADAPESAGPRRTEEHSDAPASDACGGVRCWRGAREPALRAQDLPIRRWLVRGPVNGHRLVRWATTSAARRPCSPIPATRRRRRLPPRRRGFRSVASISIGCSRARPTRAPRTPTPMCSRRTDRTVLLVMDSDDDLVAWLNGQRVWVHVVARGMGSGSDTVGVRLAAGWNSLLLKAVNRSGGFDVLGRLARAPGETAARRHPPRLSAPARVLHGAPPPRADRHGVHAPAERPARVEPPRPRGSGQLRRSRSGDVTPCTAQPPGSTQDSSSWSGRVADRAPARHATNRRLPARVRGLAAARRWGPRRCWPSS